MKKFLLIFLSFFFLTGASSVHRTENQLSSKSVNSSNIVQSYRLVDMDTLTGASGSAYTLDTTHFRVGSGAITLTAPTGGTAWVDKTINFTPEANLPILIKYWTAGNPSSAAGDGYIWIYLSVDGGFTNYVLYKMNLATTGLNETSISPGYKDWYGKPEDATLFGNATLAGPFTKIRVKCLANPGKAYTVSVDEVLAYWSGTPRVVIADDDGSATFYNVAKPILDAAGFKASCYIVGSYLGTAGKMTKAQVTQLNTEGYEVASHTWDHQDLTGLTQQQISDEFTRNNAFLNYSVIGKNPTGVAYPGGVYNQTVLDQAALNYTYGRRTAGYGRNLLQGENQYEIRTYSIDWNSQISDIEAAIDESIASGRTLILLYHYFETTPSSQYYTATADFQTIVTYLKNKGSAVRVCTLEEAIADATFKKSLSVPISGTLNMTNGSIFVRCIMQSNNTITINRNIIVSSAGASLLYINGSTLYCTDGTNTISMPFTYTTNKEYKLGISWEGKRLHLYNLTDHKAAHGIYTSPFASSSLVLGVTGYIKTKNIQFFNTTMTQSEMEQIQ